jgi:hypothetical protein
VSDKVWKAAERALAKWFPKGKRRGADFRGQHAGKTDIISEGWALEVKHLKRPTFGEMMGAVLQAERNREKPDDIPVALIHRVGEDYKNTLVVMRLETFAEHFINLE